MINTISLPRRLEHSITPKPSVYMTSMWAHPYDGWSVATRAYLKAFNSAGRGIILGYDAFNRPTPEVYEDMKWMLDSAPMVDAIDLMIWGGMIGGANRMVPLFNELKRQGSSGVYMVFERLTFERQLIDALKGLPIYVESPTNKKVLEGYDIECEFIEFPIFPNDPYVAIAHTKGISASSYGSRLPYRFYWIGCWEPRKAPHRLIKAFMQAFNPSDECTLTLKVSPLGRGFDWDMTPERAILEGMRDNPKWTIESVDTYISIIRDRLTDAQMLELHRSNGVYVSPSLGEALELGAWNAKLSGSRIIATPSGGINHYLDSSNDILIPANNLQEAHKGYQWGSHAMLIDYDLDDLVQALRQSIDTPWARITGTWPTISSHDCRRVGEKLVSWCERHV